jgi:hypothetical protein
LLALLSQTSLVEGENSSNLFASKHYETDANGDDRVSALDALRVLNYLAMSNRTVGAHEEVITQVVEAGPSEPSAGTFDEEFVKIAEGELDEVLSLWGRQVSLFAPH